MQVLVAMSGGVDSSVAAALLLEAGHEVVGVTMKLWGGEGDSGCCSVSDVDDARRVAQQLGIDHAVFNFGDDFTRHVVDPYVEAHRGGRTPNPCVECNRHLKFARLLERADRLGFDRVATGHHARVVSSGGAFRLLRGADRAKDQSYVLHMLGQQQLRRVMLPVGELDKGEVRARAVGARIAHGIQTGQPGCVLHHEGGWPARVPERPDGAAARPRRRRRRPRSRCCGCCRARHRRAASRARCDRGRARVRARCRCRELARSRWGGSETSSSTRRRSPMSRSWVRLFRVACSPSAVRTARRDQLSSTVRCSCGNNPSAESRPGRASRCTTPPTLEVLGGGIAA